MYKIGKEIETINPIIPEDKQIRIFHIMFICLGIRQTDIVAAVKPIPINSAAPKNK